MKFRTEIEIAPAQHKIDYSSRVLSLGSCFAQSIGERLESSKFKVCVNPTGVLFNPLSICSIIDRFEKGCGVELADLRSGREGWFHFDFHGSLCDSDADVARAKINNAVATGHDTLCNCDTIIITLGTVWVYELRESGEVVANCHKERAANFLRRAMSVAEVVDALGAVVARYPNKQFIFSVSPVRHIADGLAENSLSKATLRVALAQIVEQYPNATYFAAYEVMMDDLRDYRFYADDMVHPSAQAVDYIWSKFVESHIAAEVYPTMEFVESVVRAAAHRPFNVESDAHQKFCSRQLELINAHPEIDFGKENVYFMSQLQKK